MQLVVDAPRAKAMLQAYAEKLEARAAKLTAEHADLKQEYENLPWGRKLFRSPPREKKWAAKRKKNRAEAAREEANLLDINDTVVLEAEDLYRMRQMGIFS